MAHPGGPGLPKVAHDRLSQSFGKVHKDCIHGGMLLTGLLKHLMHDKNEVLFRSARPISTLGLRDHFGQNCIRCLASTLPNTLPAVNSKAIQR